MVRRSVVECLVVYHRKGLYVGSVMSSSGKKKCLIVLTRSVQSKWKNVRRSRRMLWLGSVVECL